MNNTAEEEDQPRRSRRTRRHAFLIGLIVAGFCLIGLVLGVVLAPAFPRTRQHKSSSAVQIGGEDITTTHVATMNVVDEPAEPISSSATGSSSSASSLPGGEKEKKPSLTFRPEKEKEEEEEDVYDGVDEGPLKVNLNGVFESKAQAEQKKQATLVGISSAHCYALTAEELRAHIADVNCGKIYLTQTNRSAEYIITEPYVIDRPVSIIGE